MRRAPPVGWVLVCSPACGWGPCFAELELVDMRHCGAATCPHRRVLCRSYGRDRKHQPLLSSIRANPAGALRRLAALRQLSAPLNSPRRNRTQAQKPPRAWPGTEHSTPVANPASSNQLRPSTYGGPDHPAGPPPAPSPAADARWSDTAARVPSGSKDPGRSLAIHNPSLRGLTGAVPIQVPVPKSSQHPSKKAGHAR